MTGASIKIEVGDKPVLQAFNDLIAAVENPAPAMASIGEYLLMSIERRFDSQSGPGHIPWKPLSNATLRRKKGHKILTESQRLRGSFVYRVSGNTLEVGTNVVYAAIHQFGGDIERAAYAIKQRLRVTPGGKLSRQPGDKRLAVYAKRSSKRYREVVAEIGAHKIHMPARPMLGIDGDDSNAIVNILGDIVRHAWRQRGG